MKFKKYNTISKEELKNASKVIKSTTLSKFLGEYHPDFYGGKNVKNLEKTWAKYFGVKYAVSVNSWTSGLVACVGSLDINPGDEIILPTWTMSACSSSILHWNAVPIFADIEEDTFNICPKSILRNITKRTKAIMTVDIFGQPSKMKEILKIAKNNNLKVITDSAQAIGATYGKKYAGTLGDVGGYSLNYHKHIQSGEGGVCVTNNKLIYERLMLIRNHGESVIENFKKHKLNNIIGQNFRMGEVEASIAIAQLKKLKKIIFKIRNSAKKLRSGLQNLKGLKLASEFKDSKHAYYVLSMTIDEKILKKKRSFIAKKLGSLGIPISVGYRNLHMLPMFQKKIAYGNKGFPWKGLKNSRFISYKKGICPVAEELHDKTFIGLPLTVYDFSNKDINYIIKCFKKIWSNF